MDHNSNPERTTEATPEPAESGSAPSIERARLADVDGILRLAEDNYPEQGGELSGHLVRASVVETIQALPSVVARSDGHVIGFLLTWRKSKAASPFIQAMLAAYSGSDDAYVYGPICVDSSARGRGIAGAMFAELRRLLPRREGILFIKANNEPSLRAHRKMGMRVVAEYTFQGTPFFVLAYRG